MARIKAQIEATAGEIEVLFRYLPLHLGDWITGTAGMTLEHEGAYMRFLAHLYNRGKPFPDDDTFMARVMNLSSRVWKRIKAALIDMGKIVCRNGALTNARFEIERCKRAEEMRKKAAAAEARWGQKRQSLPEVSPKFAESLPEVLTKLAETEPKKANEINETAKIVHMESVIRNPISEIRDKKVVVDCHNLADRMFEAGGVALNRAAGSLEVMSEPRGWMEQGCDLELDILPVVRLLSGRAKPGSVRQWRYFAGAVVEARDRRKTALPEAPAASQAVSSVPAWKLEVQERNRKQKETLDRLAEKWKKEESVNA